MSHQGMNGKNVRGLNVQEGTLVGSKIVIDGCIVLLTQVRDINNLPEYILGLVNCNLNILIK